MNLPVVELRNVTKTFRYTDGYPGNLKALLVSIFDGSYFKLKKETKTVLENVSFKVGAGEIVGIMGRNGTGKSTLMRILSGIYQPDSGEVIVRERIAPMVAMGAGLHLELSGYENIFLNAAIIGVPRSEIDGLVPDIIAFSELKDDIHRPVKHYSSGMLLRLGFSIAAHISAPILILDEVMGVGDEGFQKKSFAKLKQLFESGRTVFLVTHDPAQVQKYCQRCIVFEKGRMIFDGKADEGTKCYLGLFETAGQPLNFQA